MTTPMGPAPAAEAAAVALAERVVAGGFFLVRTGAPERTEFRRADGNGEADFRHVCTYAGGGSSIGSELISMIEGAREKIFVATLYLGDPDVRTALLRAADRLRGGVYVLSALDDKGLDKAINEVDDATDIDTQTEFRNFRGLTRNGVYVRGYPGLHAKFVVVDDRVALVSSANLVTRSFHRVGENGTVVTEPAAVGGLARLFGRLWQESPWVMPPSRHYVVEESRSTLSRIEVAAPRGNGPISRGAPPPASPPTPLWTYSGQWGILGAIQEVVENAREELVLATYSIANMAPGRPGTSALPELVFEPVSRAIARGVRVRMLLRGRNNVRSSRREATAFADAGVEVYADRFTHAKGVIADRRRGALFSANLETDRGLTGGVEVGMRLDRTAAIQEALRYFAHVMDESDMEFARHPRLADLADRVAAEDWRLQRWPLPSEIAVVADDAGWRRLAEQSGPALHERRGRGPITLYSGRDQWVLTEVDGGAWTMRAQDRAGGRRDAAELLDSWLTTRHQPEKGLRRGLCPATLVRRGGQPRPAAGR